MTDFVLVLATAALLTGPPAAPDALLAPAAASIGEKPSAAPRHGFPDAASCERAAESRPAPPGRRFVCLPHDFGAMGESAH